MRRLNVLIAILLLTGCSSTSREPADTAVTDEDVAVDSAPDASVSDSGSSPGDLGRQDAGDSTSDVGGGCTGPCLLVTATATVPPNEVAFERAHFGITGAAQSASGSPEIHVEAYAGGADGCPQESSPTPDQTLIVTGVPMPVPSRRYTRQDGLAVSVLDFEGSLLNDGLVVAALTASVTFEHVEEDAVALIVDAQLDGGGTVAGHLYATHCPSLDSM